MATGAAAAASWRRLAAVTALAVGTHTYTTACTGHSSSSCSGGGRSDTSKHTKYEAIGGHVGLLGGRQGKTILKPLQTGPRAARELGFYEYHANPHVSGEKVPPQFLPAYYGVVDVPVAASEKKLKKYISEAMIRAAQGDLMPAADSDSGETLLPHLELEDMTHGCKQPCVLDLKVGTKVWDDDASPTKIARVLFKYPYQATIGFRFVGMRVWRPHAAPGQPSGIAGLIPDEHGYIKHDRSFGFALTDENMEDGFREFLHDGARVRWELIPSILEQLDALDAWFQTQTTFKFYSASLLMVYDGAAGGDAAVSVRLIDFAHAHIKPNGLLDKCFLIGLTRARQSLRRLLKHQDGAAEYGTEPTS